MLGRSIKRRRRDRDPPPSRGDDASGIDWVANTTSSSVLDLNIFNGFFRTPLCDKMKTSHRDGIASFRKYFLKNVALRG